MQNKYSYPSSIIQTINSVIKECAASTGLYPTQSNPSQYLCSFFSMDENYYIPDNAFLCIWYNLIQFQRLGKQYWIKSYWEQAVSYANLHLDGYMSYYEGNPNRTQLLFRFQQFHHVYCGYLLSCKEYSLLAHMRGFSNSIPYSNSLVPDKLQDICEQMEALDPIYNPLYMDSHYNFFQINGVRDGSIARAWTHRYYCICCLVDPTIDFNLNYTGKSIDYKIRLSRQLAKLIDYISNDLILSELVKDPLFTQNFKVI